jgi:hypothetical protein
MVTNKEKKGRMKMDKVMVGILMKNSGLGEEMCVRLVGLWEEKGRVIDEMRRREDKGVSSRYSERSGMRSVLEVLGGMEWTKYVSEEVREKRSEGRKRDRVVVEKLKSLVKGGESVEEFVKRLEEEMKGGKK